METSTNLHLSASIIKECALKVGFNHCGIAQACPIDSDTWQKHCQWLKEGLHADMHYLENYAEQRMNPQLLVPGCKSIVSVALNYYPSTPLPPDEYQLAWYAYGKDYHDIVKQKLREMWQLINATLPQPFEPTPQQEVRLFCDTGPVMERYWAWKAGLGWIGRNTQLIIPHAGSAFFLGEMFLPFTTEYDTPMPSRCGTCHACIDHCPTHALQEGKPFDARRCLSYLTIENRGAIPSNFQQAMGNSIYGCDQCQRACPHTRFAQPTTEPLLQPSPQLLGMKKDDWHTLTREQYTALFKGSAVKRAKYDGLMRNISMLSHKN